MKKYILFILVILGIVSMAGCGNTTNTESEAPGKGQDYFNAVVLDVEDDKVLAVGTECESGAISVGSEVSIHMDTVSSEEVPILNVEDTIRVVYAGEVMETDPLKLEKVISIFWIDENGEIITSGAEIKDIQHEPLQDAEWGITLTAKDVVPTGLTLVCAQTGVEITGELITGSDFSLSKFVDGAWEKVEYVPQEHEVAWTSEAWMIPLEDTVEWEVSWEWLYGELPSGQYRIGKPVMNLIESGNFETAMHFAEFTIE